MSWYTCLFTVLFQDANKLLSGKKGCGRLKYLQKMLRMREQYMISQVCTLYPVKASNDIISRDKLDPQSDGGKSGTHLLFFIFTIDNIIYVFFPSCIPLKIREIECIFLNKTKCHVYP